MITINADVQEEEDREEEVKGGRKRSKKRKNEKKTKRKKWKWKRLEKRNTHLMPQWSELSRFVLAGHCSSLASSGDLVSTR